MKISIPLKTLITSGIFSLLLTTTAYAQTCKVTDPTGTPLNVRDTVAGKVIGKLSNGKVVYIAEYAYDSKGRPWVLVFDVKTDAYIGWVYREFVSCY